MRSLLFLLLSGCLLQAELHAQAAAPPTPTGTVCYTRQAPPLGDSLGAELPEQFRLDTVATPARAHAWQAVGERPSNPLLPQGVIGRWRPLGRDSLRIELFREAPSAPTVLEVARHGDELHGVARVPQALPPSTRPPQQVRIVARTFRGRCHGDL